jgi:hypothetical protein
MTLWCLYFDPDRIVIFPYDHWRRFSDERAPLCTEESRPGFLPAGTFLSSDMRC